MPGTHSAMSRHMFTLNGNVLASGGAKNLAKGQFTIVKSDTATSAGATVVGVGDFAGLSAKQVLEMRLGKHRVPEVRTALNSKPYSSETFKLSDIVDIKKITPKFETRKFDELIVGYDGVNDSTAINLAEGEHAVLDILLKGDHVGFVTNSCSYPLKFHFGREVGETNQEAVKRAVKSLKAMTLTNGVSVNEVVDISVVDSSNPALAGTEFVFQSLTVTDAGDSNALALVQAQYPTLKVVRTDRDILKSIYTVVTAEGVTLADFVLTDVSLADADCDGEAEVISTETEISWVVGESCFATEQTYTIQLADNECGNSRLTELQAFYPELTITEVALSAGGCQRKYETTVLTNIVCEECSDIFLGQFESKAPIDFNFTSWTLVEAPANENAKMGIKIKGKAFDWTPTDISRDQIPFYETSTRVEASGGYVIEVNESFQDNFKDLFTITRLSRAQDRDNLGGHLLMAEEASRAYFDGEKRHVDNLYAKAVLGEESVLDFKKQYVQYAITIHDSKYSQGVGRRSDMGTTYNIWAELGKDTALDTYISALATKVGIAL
jgi:hypothetical protein